MSVHGALVLGVDASTSGVKALVVDAEGGVLAEGRASYALERTGDGGAEQDAERWDAATREALAAAVGALDAGARARIRALAIAHQRETFVVTDPAGLPLAPALVWMDARCAPEVDAAGAELDPMVAHARSGKVASPTPSLYKLRFLFDRLRPELRAVDKRVCDVHAFLVWRLTGTLATSLSSADPLGLVDLERRAWDDALCAVARVRPDELPRLIEPGARIAPLSPVIASELGLGEVWVVAGAGDGQAAGLGTGVLAPEQAYVNLGTAIVSGRPSATCVIDRAFRTLYAADARDYLLETDLLGGTLSFDWLVDVLLGDQGGAMQGGAARHARLAELEREAATLPPGSDGLVALPYLAGVMNPHWDASAAGVLLGLRIDHGPAHVYRALVEGLALELRAQLEAVEARVGVARELRVTGGGAQRPLFRQIVADVLGRELALVEAPEATALGAAALAHASLTDGDARAVARRWSRAAAGVSPGGDRVAYDRLYRDVYVGLYASLAPSFAALSSLRSSFSQARRSSA